MLAHSVKVRDLRLKDILIRVLEDTLSMGDNTC